MDRQPGITILFYIIYWAVIVVVELFSIYQVTELRKEVVLGVMGSCEKSNVCVNGIYEILPIGM